MRLNEALLARRSVRKHTSLEVDHLTISSLIDEAVQAPSAVDQQLILHSPKGAAIAVLAVCVAGYFAEAVAQTSRPPAIVSVCAPCHGADGAGGDVEKPNLAGQKSIYIRQQLMAFREGKRKHADMKSIARKLTDREIDQLVVYYSTLTPP